MRQTITVRFWAKVRFSDGCWEWMACKTPEGYGKFCVAGRPVGAHRWAYEQTCGRIPHGLHLDHLCLNPSCVRPDHLEAVTPRTNILRGLHGFRMRAASCLRGHEFTERNTGRTPAGHRFCRRCHAEREQHRRALNPRPKRPVSTRYIEACGERLTLKEWACRLGIHPTTLIHRLSKWPAEVALSTPRNSGRKDRCRTAAGVPLKRVCKGCGHVFAPPRRHTLYCSRVCVIAAKARHSRYCANLPRERTDDRG